MALGLEERLLGREGGRGGGDVTVVGTFPGKRAAGMRVEGEQERLFSSLFIFFPRCSSTDLCTFSPCG